MFGPIAQGLPHVVAQRRALGVTGPEASPLLPGVKPLVDQGFPGLLAFNSYPVMAPAGTPDAIVDKVRAGLKQAMSDPALRERLSNAAIDLVWTEPAELRKALAEDRKLERACEAREHPVAELADEILRTRPRGPLHDGRARVAGEAGAHADHLPPGGPSELVTRLVNERPQDLLKQPFVVENRAGAGGNVGADVVVKAVPDGHTFGITTDTLHRESAGVRAHDVRPVEGPRARCAAGKLLADHGLQSFLPVKDLAEAITPAKASA